VSGKVIPETAKPVAFRAAALIVTSTVPVEVRVTGCGVAAVFTTTLPNATLVELTLSVGTAAPSCRAKVSDTPLAVAVSVTVCAVLTGDTVAVNPTLAAPAATVTVDGTVIALLLLARLTVRPPLPAAAFSVTVQASVPDPVMAPLLQYSALNAAVLVPVVPVPLRSITGVAVAEELLAIDNCPVAVPAVAGLN
jgi:hypothetical protein